MAGPDELREVRAAHAGLLTDGPREPQDDARSLPADQEPAGQLLAACAGLLL